METAKQLVPLVVQGSMFLMIMAVAMETNAANVIERVRHPSLLLKGIVAVNLVVPATAIVLVLLFPLDRPVAIGLLLMAVSPLAPLVPGNALKAGARRSDIVSLYTMLIVIAIVIVPVTVSIMNGVFGAHAKAPLPAIAQVIIVSAVTPIALGLILGTLWPTFSARVAPVLTKISNVILLLFILAIFWVAGREFLSMIGNGTILAFALTSGAGVIAGHMLGGPDRGRRSALALAASIRHPGIAAAVGHASGADKHAMAATILFLINGVIVTSLYRIWLERHPTRESAN